MRVSIKLFAIAGGLLVWGVACLPEPVPEETGLANGELCISNEECQTGHCIGLRSCTDLTVLEERCGPAECDNHYMECTAIEDESCEVFEGGVEVDGWVDTSTDPIQFILVSNKEDEWILRLIVSGPVDDCESSEREDDATEMWSIENDEQGLPNPVEYGVVPEGALENVSATELTSGSCYQWWMASSFAEQWGRFTAP